MCVCVCVCIIYACVRTLTNVLPQSNSVTQTQGTTLYPVTVYKHGADLSLRYPLMWSVTLEYTATQFNVLGKTRHEILPRPSTHTSEHSTL